MQMVEEFRSVGEHRFIDEPPLVNEGFIPYLAWLERGERGELQDERLVPWSAFWAVGQRAGELVGVSSLRHKLSPWMAEYGGHIGYRVRPALRGKGLGTQILALTLQRAAARGISRALIVCEPENVGSIKVILKNGGIFEREVQLQGSVRRRYWVRTSDSDA